MTARSMEVKEVEPGPGQIPLSEVDYHPLSFCDANGRLFWWRGQLYRGIKGRRDYYHRLFQDGTVQRLIDKGLLVPSEPANLSLDGYDLVLKHRSVPFVSYPFEWCNEMLKDAALLTIDLEMELTRYGLTLQDAHPWNILFDGARPVWVDFTSLVHADRNWAWNPYDEFCRYFLHPLQLMAHGRDQTARWLLRDFEQLDLRFYLPALIRKPYRGFAKRQAMRSLLSVANQRVPGLIPKKVCRLLHGLLSRPASRLSCSPLDFLKQLRRTVEDITPSPLSARRSEDHEGGCPSFEPSGQWTSTQWNVYKVLSDLRPSSVVDISSHRAWYSQLPALLGSRVVAFDLNGTYAAQLYRDAKAKNLPILPLVVNIGRASPAHGRYSQRLAPATQRLRCELVLAVGSVHHLVFEQDLKFDQITDVFSTFSSRWLLTEFIPRENRREGAWWPERYLWYTLENFMAALRRGFRSIRVYPSHPDPSVLLLCEK